MSSSEPIVVYGASGVVGRRVCGALIAAGAPVLAAGRARHTIAPAVPGVPVRVAAADDPAALARAFEGARVVVNAAGPAAEVGDEVLRAALDAGAHLVDVALDQRHLHAAYERHESRARRAGVVAVLGAGVGGTLGELAAALAVARLDGPPPPAAAGPAAVLRGGPAPRLAADRPLDEVAVTYVFDDLALSPGSQRTLFASVGERALRWRRDRWEAVLPGEARDVDAGAAFGGPRRAVAFAGPDVITIPRGVATGLVQTYASTTRRPALASALGVLGRALPFAPRGLAELLAPHAPPEEAYARTRFAVVAQVRRGFAAAEVCVAGADLYRTTAEIAAFLATSLAARATGPLGMRTAGELLHPEAALAALAARAGLTIGPTGAQARAPGGPPAAPR